MYLGWALWAALCAVCAAHESFREHLTLRPLAGARVHAAFSFELASDDASLHHFRILPRALLQPVASLDVDALQLTLTAGRWQYARWGTPAPLDGDEATASGAEIWASFAAQHASLGKRWRVLTSALASVFCTSLDAIDEATSVSPSRDYFMQRANTTQLHAYLPAESVCTENITPILKLLPCKNGAGLASLIQSHTILSAEFHSMSVKVVKTAHGHLVKLGIQAVMRAPLMSQTTNWTLEQVFGRSLDSVCPVADSSTLSILAPSDTDVAPLPADHAVEDAGRYFGTLRSADEIDLGIDAPFSYVRPERLYRYNTLDLAAYGGALHVAFVADVQGPLLHPPPFRASRQVRGYGQERNTVCLTLRNDLAVPVHVAYYDHLPWFILPLMHTLQAHAAVDAYDEHDGFVRFRDEVETPFVGDAAYTPPVLRNSTGSVELTLRVPAASTLTVTYTILKRVLHYAEHVPDPHRGVDLPPAMFVLLHTPTHASAMARVQAARIYTAPSLLDIAVPDFSMPYNIILFYSTFVALFFGSLLNIMIRRFYDVVVEA
ncbi:Subunit of the glycosylphosphatidylinositol transamidase complex-like protein [Malassezia vespertilionis]|uniref:Subunit of the glycosylphosphatidylinositol transamidase complex-like protein n=1 Tax=Malassezia vespertilionis TaxID=2020962 RepID=UPI0024B09219|nr:Subunit of the glycosylphosphatidylinositol transamidase complex-like protein [Malassezia vespertilionis]WFD05989.1 Subunit of the glycosylphosphatidylinositol transamidase complex-like protein [Malassezia vespertilionis]